MNFDWATVSGLLRHIATFGGGFLVANGTIAQPDLETAVGALVSLIGIVWSVVAKRKPT